MIFFVPLVPQIGGLQMFFEQSKNKGAMEEEDAHSFASIFLKKNSCRPFASFFFFHIFLMFKAILSDLEPDGCAN
jgi:hypothetical protein